MLETATKELLEIIKNALEIPGKIERISYNSDYYLTKDIFTKG